MNFDLEHRRVQMSVGELSDFSIGPHGSAGGHGGLWRAQLGSRWHRQLRDQVISEGQAAEFEVVLSGEVFHRGWTLSLSGRIDQVVQRQGRTIVREIKTVTDALPVPEERLREDYPEYFAQLATYAALRESAPGERVECELVFVEVDTGLAQTVPLTATDKLLHHERLGRVCEFLDLRLQARERLRGLSFRPAFKALRAGQESIQGELDRAALAGRSAVLLEAPTGFGKTGVLLEFMLRQLKAGPFERALYLTGKSTGQLQVVETLAAMTSPGPDLGPGQPLRSWQVRNKAEHCVNTVFHCTQDACAFLAGQENRWAASGLSRFYLFDNQRNDLAALREAGKKVKICPYEITRAALAFNDVWIGDFNYVFSPESRGLFYDQPGFDPGRTLLIVDEAHNLPSRAADAYSRELRAADAREILQSLREIRATGRTVAEWETWVAFLDGLEPCPELEEGKIKEARQILSRLSETLSSGSIDFARLGPGSAEKMWTVGSLPAQLEASDLPRLWWCPEPGELSATCLDAAPAIGSSLRQFGAVILATATPGPAQAFAQACGLDDPEVVAGRPPGPDRLGELNKRKTRKVFAQLTSGAELLKAAEVRESESLLCLKAHTPWRENAYDVAVDLRVDTSFQQRERFKQLTAETIAAVRDSAGSGKAVVFFSSFAYAESVLQVLSAQWPTARAALQPKRRELAAQSAWVEQSLAESDVLFLVLGSSFAESIDLLGGRVSHAVVVGPALPEVNPVQKARFASLDRAIAFERVYGIPGIQKVNQALGRLVRAPGQSAKVLLHCRRFAEPAYTRLLVEEYRSHRRILDPEELQAWLRS